MEMLKEIDNSAAVDYLTMKKRAKISRSFFFEGKKKKECISLSVTRRDDIFSKTFRNAVHFSSLLPDSIWP